MRSLGSKARIGNCMGPADGKLASWDDEGASRATHAPTCMFLHCPSAADSSKGNRFSKFSTAIETVVSCHNRGLPGTTGCVLQEGSSQIIWESYPENISKNI